MGLLPTADRNNVPGTEIVMEEAEPEEIQEITDAPETEKIEKPCRPSGPKLSSTSQLEPVLQQYCRVEKGGFAFYLFSVSYLYFEE